jgi:multicomponent Na+:H+ antiporter subunit E
VSTVAYGLVLAVIWVLLWGSWSAANVLSGLLVAAVLVLAFVPAERRREQIVVIRPLPFLALAAYLVRQLLVANVVLITEVLARRRTIRTGVIAVPVPGCSEQLLTIFANIVAMAPGTMPVEVRSDPPAMYVHILHLRDVEEVRAELIHLRDLMVRALGSGEAIAATEDR